MGVAKMFTAGWVSGRRQRTGRRVWAWALSAAGLSAAPDWGRHPRLSGGQSLLGWKGPAAVCAAVSLLIVMQGHVDEGRHNDSVIIVVCHCRRGLQGQDVHTPKTLYCQLKLLPIIGNIINCWLLKKAINCSQCNNSFITVGTSTTT
jgi:hypothetical protein